MIRQGRIEKNREEKRREEKKKEERRVERKKRIRLGSVDDNKVLKTKFRSAVLKSRNELEKIEKQR